MVHVHTVHMHIHRCCGMCKYVQIHVYCWWFDHLGPLLDVELESTCLSG